MLPLVMSASRDVLFARNGNTEDCVNTPQKLHSPLKEVLAKPELHDNLWQIEVSRAGLQSIDGSLLRNAGATSFTQVQIWRAGELVSMDAVDVNADGIIDSNDSIRFFAQASGDRWNRSTHYWLAIKFGLGAWMMEDAPPDTGTMARNTALERGEWRVRNTYLSSYPGPQGDYWFADSFKLVADIQTQTDFEMTQVLPSAPGPVQFMVDMVTDVRSLPPFRGRYTLGISLGNGPATYKASVSSYGGQTHSLYVNSNATDGRLSWSAQDAVRIHLQAVRWLRPITLTFDQGAYQFETATRAARYHISAPPGSRLYDVTDAVRPMRVAMNQGDFESAGDRRYVLAVPGGENAVRVQHYNRFREPAVAINAKALYIGSAAWQGAITPLIAHRVRSGTSAAFMSLESIYDWFSDGDVSPEAIRSYLRYARDMSGHADPRPAGVILLGDANFDPFNQQRLDLCTAFDASSRCIAGNDYRGANILPPYMAHVDAYIGEAACDTCYVRFDCDSVLQDKLPDAMMGRLPASTTGQLTAIVQKIIAYETSTQGGAWRNTEYYFADDPDDAGDFGADSDKVGDMQPAGITRIRAYYDLQRNGPEFIKDVAEMNSIIKDGFSKGAAIIHYRGHGFSGGWAHPVLFQASDVEDIQTTSRTPFVMSFACSTGRFANPLELGMSIDERLFVQRYGAIGVWGSAGEDETRAYTLLARGFYSRLWNDSIPAQSKTLGNLAQAGYNELLTLHPSATYLNSLGTYTLLGDPFTVLKIQTH